MKKDKIMFTKLALCAGLAGLLMGMAHAQEPSIVSMRGGNITFTNLSTNLEYRLEWAPQLGREFQARFDTLENIAPTGITAMTVDIPQFFRIAGQPALSNGIVRASDLPLVIHATTNLRYRLEWSASPNGPWQSQWTTAQEMASTGMVISVPVPNYYRITYLN